MRITSSATGMARTRARAASSSGRPGSDATGRGLPLEGRDSMTITFDPGWMLRVDNGGTVEQLHGELDAVMASLSWVRP